MRTHLKPVALPLFLLCALSIRASQEEPKPPDLDKAERESTEQAFRAAIQKLREPLEEDQEFRALSSDVGRFETMREVSITFGHRVAHEEIDRDMKEHPKSAFERLMSFQSTGESPTLLGRLRSEKPRLTPESNIDLKWITNQPPQRSSHRGGRMASLGDRRPTGPERRSRDSLGLRDGPGSSCVWRRCSEPEPCFSDGGSSERRGIPLAGGRRLDGGSDGSLLQQPPQRSLQGSGSPGSADRNASR